MQTNPYSPYALKDLYQAIDLIDRKIAHSRTHDTFESDPAQGTHLRKLSTKRATLVKSALVLTNLGVQCKPEFLPRSFIHPVQQEGAAVIENPIVADEIKSEKPPRPRQKRS